MATMDWQSIPGRHVAIVVDDAQLGELLVDALDDGGHTGEVVTAERLPEVLRHRRFDAAIVDLDMRARNGAAIVALLREQSPSTTVVGLLPCGGLPAGSQPAPCHLSLEKPARLGAVMAALANGVSRA